MAIAKTKTLYERLVKLLGPADRKTKHHADWKLGWCEINCYFTVFTPTGTLELVDIWTDNCWARTVRPEEEIEQILLELRFNCR